MLRIRALLVSPFLLSAAAGCGRTASETPSSPEPRIVPVGDYRVTVEVENQNFYQATIYAYRPGSRLRLGIVGTSEKETFAFSWPTGDLRFLVDFLAVGCLLTPQPLAVTEGDELILILQPQDYRGATQAVCRAGR